MLETLSLCLVVGGIYMLLLLIIVQGWLLVWQSFLSRFDLLQELLGEDLATGLLGGSDAARLHRNQQLPQREPLLLQRERWPRHDLRRRGQPSASAHLSWRCLVNICIPQSVVGLCHLPTTCAKQPGNLASSRHPAVIHLDFF
ncbi:hypothetical protein HPB49_016562 [Dermacentor silvarum]|uniref:Uncharacterized protein n=1 Tax=Dermacentor silvarum TaxID=543639 RepID=A0ACB8DQ34_DERSI|nr:hypothetical protein HPB49_016562 [Dermacentor silvarum]